MDKHDGEQAARTQIQERGVGAKERRVRELQDGASERRGWRRVWVRQPELIVVVNMSEAEDDGRCVDDLAGWTARDEEEGHGGRTEEYFFCYGTLKYVSKNVISERVERSVKESGW